MDPLDREHAALIVDYCLGLCTPSGAAETWEFIARSDLASGFHSQVQTALGALAYLPAEPCPDYLAELTIRRLHGLAAQKAYTEVPSPRVIRVNPRQWFKNKAAVTAVAAAIVVVAGVFIRPIPPTHHRQYLEVPPRSMENLLPNVGLYGSDYIRLQNTSWPEVPSSMANVYGPIEYYPGRPYHFIEVGPPIPPASLEEILEHQLKDHPVQPQSSLVPDMER